MNIIYKKYEPGFEEHQAFVYNEAVKKYSGETVTAKEIKDRIESHTPIQDLEGINFAFNEDGQPLAYIQYRIYQGNEIYIGYPWATENCPQDVQDTLYSNLEKYIKIKYPSEKFLFMGNISDDYTDVHKQISKYGFEKETWLGYYTLDPKNATTIPFEGFSYREVKPTDIDIILAIAQLDPSINTDNNEERWKNYFVERFKDTTMLLLNKENTAIASIGFTTSSLTEKEIQTRFIVFNPTYEKYFDKLLGAIGKYSNEKKITGTYQIILGTGEESRIPVF